MYMLKKIAKAEGDFVSEKGKDATFLIMSASDAGELAYEIALDEGMAEDQAYTHDLTHYNGKFICVVFDPSFRGFVLK